MGGPSFLLKYERMLLPSPKRMLYSAMLVSFTKEA